MSKQPRDVRDSLERLKAQGLILPEAQDGRQLWLLVRADPSDTAPGCFFITHWRNFDKFNNRKGFTILGRSFDKPLLQQRRRELEDAAPSNYKPKFTARSLSTIERPADRPPQGSTPGPSPGEYLNLKDEE